MANTDKTSSSYWSSCVFILEDAAGSQIGPRTRTIVWVVYRFFSSICHFLNGKRINNLLIFSQVGAAIRVAGNK